MVDSHKARLVQADSHSKKIAVWRVAIALGDVVRGRAHAVVTCCGPASKESTKLASRARLGFQKDLPLVLRGVPPSLGLRRHFGRGTWNMEGVDG